MDLPGLESQRNNKRAMAWLFLGIGVINTVISVWPVEVSTTGSDIQLSYKF